MALVATVVAIERPMSWSEFLAVPAGERAEYSEGVAIVSPPPTF